MSTITKLNSYSVSNNNLKNEINNKLPWELEKKKKENNKIKREKKKKIKKDYNLLKKKIKYIKLFKIFLL